MSTHRAVRAVVLAAALVVPATAATLELADAPWPTTQHDSQRTGQSALTGILGQPVVAWQRPLPSSAAPAELVVDESGSIYVKTGSRTIRFTPDGTGTEIINHGGTCGSSVTLTDEGFYLGHGGIFSAHQPDGQARWYARYFNRCMHSTPAVAGATVYFGADNTLVAADAKTGALRWFYSFGGPVHGTPAIAADGTIYLASEESPRGLYAIEPDGALKWLRPGLGFESDPAVAGDGTVYSANPNLLSAANPDGTTKWVFAFDEAICSYRSPAIADDGTIYFGTAVNSRNATETGFYAVNPDGTLKWRFPVPRDGFPRVCSSPTVDAAGNVYFCADNGRCYALDSGGKERWNLLLSENDWIRASPVIADSGRMYVAFDDQLLALVSDSDGDGDQIIDEAELDLGSDPDRADTDGDGLDDGHELRVGRSPLVNELAIMSIIRDIAMDD